MKDKSAFPHPRYGTLEMLVPDSPGMTFKEWQWTQFAATGLQAFGTTAWFQEHYYSSGKITHDLVAENACKLADAMMAAIAEREQEHEEKR